MSRRHHRAAGLIAAVIAGGQLLTPANAWAAGTSATAGSTAAAGVSVVGTVMVVRTADAALVVNRAYLFRDSRPRTVRFGLTAGTAVVVNGAPAGLGAVRAGMRVTVTGTQTSSGKLATRIVAGR